MHELVPHRGEMGAQIVFIGYIHAVSRAVVRADDGVGAEALARRDAGEKICVVVRQADQPTRRDPM